MRRRRTVEYSAPGLRGEVAAAIAGRYGELWRRQGGTGEPPASWVGRASRIEAGEAVRVASWELPREHPAYAGTGWYVLKRDGSLSPVPRSPLAG